MKSFFSNSKRRLLLLLSVFGPATITAMADNDANGVVTYSIAGARLGYPILFSLMIITILLALTQEMGMRLTLITRKGLGDLIRERYGVRASVFIFCCLFVANMGSIIVNLAAVKTTSAMLSLPIIPVTLGVAILAFIVVLKGNYKINQNVFLISCLFYVAYIFSAIKAKPDWGLATSNLLFPHGVEFTRDYLLQYLVIGIGVLGTTITPWGQFFISSFAFDKKIESSRLKYSQFETYWGAFLTDFFSFFMIVATAATLYANKIPITSGEEAALAIKPFAGELASMIFAFGILNAGFMGVIIVSLSTAYAFSEFFGFSGSLDSSFGKGKNFYTIFLVQLVIAFIIVLFPSISLFQIAIAAQTLNATMLPFIFYYLINLTSNPALMGEFTNTKFQKYVAFGATIVISIAALANIVFNIIRI